MPQLPKWNDPGSVALFLTAVLAAIFGIIKTFNPAVHQPGWTQALVPVAAGVIAIVAIAVNVVTHRKSHRESAVALAKQVVNNRIVQTDAKQVAAEVIGLLPPPEQVDIQSIVDKVLSAIPALPSTDDIVEQVVRKLAASIAVGPAAVALPGN